MFKKTIILFAILASTSASALQPGEQPQQYGQQPQPQDQYVPPYMQGQQQQYQQQYQTPNNQTYCQGAHCGIVININQRTQTSNGNNILGTIAGGLIGGLLGNQVGKGTGKTIATVVGAAGGAVAGNVVEQRMDPNGEQKTHLFDVQVRFDDGSARTFTFNNPPSFQNGQRVQLNMNGQIVQTR